MQLRQVREMSIPAAAIESIERDDRSGNGSVVKLKCGATLCVGESIHEIKRKLRAEGRPAGSTLLQDLMSFFSNGSD